MGFVLTIRSENQRMAQVVATNRDMACYAAHVIRTGGGELISIQSTPNEWSLSIEDVARMHANRARWCKLYGRNIYKHEEDYAAREWGPAIDKALAVAHG